jgi:hypothetical protein
MFKYKINSTKKVPWLKFPYRFLHIFVSVIQRMQITGYQIFLSVDPTWHPAAAITIFATAL